MSGRALLVLLGGADVVGRVTQNDHGRLQFTYADSWLKAPDRYPLSLSMPLQRPEHPHQVIEAFLWGLLPDNTTVLGSWSKKFQVAARNPFALLSHVGEDCAGAVQFVRPERLDSVQNSKRGDIQWLTEEQVGERLRILRENHGAWRIAQDRGQFSLAGAQPKTALLFDHGRWGVPSGRIPTTHILKPPSSWLDGFPENEHFCLELARALSLPTADSRVMHFGREPAIVIERYDRIHTAAGWMRVHQEDLCQAMGLSPAKKYQSDGGPGARAIVELLRAHSGSADADVTAFTNALAFSWLSANTDAHTKNYSLLISARGNVRLAPLYDLASVLPYPDFDMNKVKLAMKIGGKYRFSEVRRRQWYKLADEIKLDGEKLIERVKEMALQMPDRVAQIKNAVTEAGLKHAIIARLSMRLTARARLCLKQLGAAG